ncbi:MAG: hypothetical protein E7345_03875 [Clostridiales bacterium]|nr:hypothetical protein [Clostridiales bacterium]
MGIGMMLASFLTPLIDWFSNEAVPAISGLLGRVIKVLVVAIIGLLKAVLASSLYYISAMLMSLIEFVEVLFRLLAGLDVEGMTMTLDGGGEGDLLIQLIRHNVVQEAFLAMCIVGVFLLVMTTVFQIIRVEYTTEGAKNAKGPILEKTFKGLCNLMLIPILCIFGVFIGNEILGLLDTATTGNSSKASISGALFVASAYNAKYDENDIRCIFPGDPYTMIYLGMAYGGMQMYEGVVNEISGDYETDITDLIGIVFNLQEVEDFVLENIVGLEIEDDYDVIDQNFINGEQGFSCTNMFQASLYYNLIEVNYVFLIVGGAIIIKCLVNVCFGMVIRLYYCTALFIMAPLVIGMSPVTDNLGKWRTSFVGKAISAYGVVIAMNLFFTINSLLMSIDIDFKGHFWDAGYSFGIDVMDDILRLILVIGGCLMIEKWSKDFSGYLGAEDAMSSGKAISKEVGDTAKKAVSTATTAALAIGAGIMTAGAGTAAVGGLAAKMGGSMALKGASAAGKAVQAGKKVSKFNQFRQTVGNGLKSFGEGLQEMSGHKASNAELAYQSKKEEYQTASTEAEDSIAEHQGWIDDYEKANSITAKKGNKRTDDEKAFLQKWKEDNKSVDIPSALNKHRDGLKEAQEKRDAAESFLSGKTDEAKTLKEASDVASASREKKLARQQVAKGALIERGRELLKSTPIGGAFDAWESWQKTEKAGASYSEEGEAALASVMDERKDGKKARYNATHKSTIDARNDIQYSLINDAMIEAINAQKAEMRVSGQKIADQIKELQKCITDVESKGKGTYDGRQYDREYLPQLRNAMFGLTDKMRENGTSIGVDGKVEVKLDTTSLEAAMAKTKGMDKKAIIDEITKVLQAEGSAGNKKLLDEILKAIDTKLKNMGGK